MTRHATPPQPGRPARRRLRLVAGAVTALGLVLAAPVRPAAAHATLEDTSPRASAVLEAAPSEIVLDFDEPVEADLGGVDLLDQNGDTVALDDPIDSGDRTQVVVPLTNPQDVPAGIYVVIYRVTSADGHPVAGSFSFQVGSSDLDQSAVLDQVTSGRSSGDDGLVDWLHGLSRWAAMLGAVVLLGGWVFVAVPARRVPVPAATGRLQWGALVLMGVGTLGSFLLQGPRVLGTGLSQAWDTGVWADVADTRYGKAMLVRLVLTGLAAVPVFGLPLAHRTPWRVAASSVGVSIVATFSISGHPGAAERAGFGVLIDAVHLVAAAAWLGGLVTLVAGGRDWLTGTDAGRVVQRFSTLAAASVAVLVATGVLQAWRLLDDVAAVGDTRYGRLLVAKVSLVVVVVVLGAMARRALARVGPRSLRSVVGAEALLGVAVLGVTAVLVAVPPSQAEPVVPYSTTVVQGTIEAEITVTPALVGANDIHVTVSLGPNTAVPASAVTLRISLPEQGVLPETIALTPEGAEHFSALGVTFAFAGSWDADLIVAPTPNETVLLQTTLEIASP